MSAVPPPNPADALVIALSTTLGPWGALAGLAFKFGSPWVMKLIENANKGTDPTVDEWKKLDDLIETPGEVLIPKRPTP